MMKKKTHLLQPDCCFFCPASLPLFSSGDSARSARTVALMAPVRDISISGAFVYLNDIYARVMELKQCTWMKITWAVIGDVDQSNATSA